MAGHTSGPGGPGNPTGPLSPTFPCRNQKTVEKSELAPASLDQHVPAELTFQLGTEPLEREIRKQRMPGYLPGVLLSLVPQGPQANPGCPEGETRTRFFSENTVKHPNHPNSLGSTSSIAGRGALSKGQTQPCKELGQLC